MIMNSVYSMASGANLACVVSVEVNGSDFIITNECIPAAYHRALFISILLTCNLKHFGFHPMLKTYINKGYLEDRVGLLFKLVYNVQKAVVVDVMNRG